MIKKSDTKWYPAGALRAVRQLGPWIVISLLVVIAFGQVDSAALSGLFQSPPEETPTPEATPTLTPTVEVVPTLTPTIEVVPTLTPTVEVLPTVTPTVEVLPTLTPTVTPLPVEPADAPVITDTMPVDAGSEELGGDPVRDRYPDDDSNLEFEWGMLFDSMALGLSYAWLCCGVFFMLLLPLGFLALWVVARRRRRRME